MSMLSVIIYDELSWATHQILDLILNLSRNHYEAGSVDTYSRLPIH